MKNETELIIRGILEDSIKFGAAIGSWHKSSVPWHQRAGMASIEAVRDCALFEIEHALNSESKDKD